jgi:hypothetical protein
MQTSRVISKRTYGGTAADDLCGVLATVAGAIFCDLVPITCSQFVGPGTVADWIACHPGETPPQSSVALVEVNAGCDDNCGTDGTFWFIDHERPHSWILGGSQQWRFYYDSFATNPNNYQPGDRFDLFIGDVGETFAPPLDGLLHMYNFVGYQEGPWRYSDRCYPVAGVTDTISWFDGFTEAPFVASARRTTKGPPPNCPA